LQQRFGGRLGAFITVGARSFFPLLLKFERDLALPRAVRIGNAAQTLHPVAGQGFNLGLRDAWELAGEILNGDRAALGSTAMLAAYRRRRRIDRRGGIWFTDSLVRVFSNDIAPLRIGRGIALALLDAMPPAKDFVVRRMTFGARG
jgi:2-octaprenyl-6-methoxyphenol hydroxylase